MNSFPAITRVTQRFQALHITSAKTSHVPVVPFNADTAEETYVLQRLAKDLDDDLALVHADIDQIHNDIVKETSRIVESIETLTATFARGYDCEQWGETKPSLHPRKQTHIDTSNMTKRTCRRRHGKVKIHRVNLHRHRKPVVVVSGAPISTKNNAVPTRNTTTSRVSRLASAALCANIIQRAVRQFLYMTLYPHGGPEQLRAAQKMTRRCRLCRWLRRWRTFISRRRRLCRKLQRREATSAIDLVGRCVARAASVVETDGKFAQAKEFHRLRRLSEALLAWMRATTMDNGD